MMRLRREGRASGHVHTFPVHEGTKTLKSLGGQLAVLAGQ